MMPMDIGISNSKSNAVQFGATTSGASLIVEDKPNAWIKRAIIGGVALHGFAAWILTRK